MVRQRPALGVPPTTDGPWLAEIVDALHDLYDLFDERLPRAQGGSGGPVRISEPAPDGPPARAVAAAEPAPDLPPPPPRAGRGASAPAWAAWATRARVHVTEGASRDDIIAACQDAGVL